MATETFAVYLQALTLQDGAPHVYITNIDCRTMKAPNMVHLGEGSITFDVPADSRVRELLISALKTRAAKGSEDAVRLSLLLEEDGNVSGG